MNKVNKIRAATVDDAVAVAALSHELGYPQSAAEAAARLRHLLAQDDDLVLVAEAADGSVAGWAHAHYSVLLAVAPYVDIKGLIVSASQRGQGLGKALTDAVADWARALGAEEVTVRSRVERTAAHAFYESRGFVLRKQSKVLVKRL